MTDTLAAVSQSLSADVRRLNTLSHNVANSATPGYRAERVGADFSQQLDSAGQGTTTDARSGDAGVAIDQRDGPLAQTGRTLDLALRGPGFFVVRHDEAELLVRGGDFRLDRDGRLVTAAGDPVLGEGGQEFVPGTQALRVDKDGRIFTGEQLLGRLKLVAVADASGLRAEAGGYRYDGALAEWDGRVQQGAIEHSNVDAAEESVRLMELTRHVESVQRAISIYDKAMDTGINHLGEN